MRIPGLIARRWSAGLVSVAILGLVLFATGQSAAQLNAPVPGDVEAPTVELPLDWAVGDRLFLDYVSTKERYRGETRISRVRIQVPTEIEVLEKRANGYVLRWSFGASTTQAEPQDVNALVSRLSARIGDNTHIDLQTDIHGTPVGIRNLDELLAKMQIAMDELDLWLAAQNIPAATADQIKAIMRQILNPQTVEQLSLKQPTVFLTMSGASLELGETYPYDDALPNPLGGRPFPAKGEIVLREVKPERDWALIELTQTTDPAALTEILLESLQTLARRNNQKAPSVSELPDLVMSDKGSYEYDTASGWPRKVTFRRLISMANTLRSEEYSFTVRAN